MAAQIPTWIMVRSEFREIVKERKDYNSKITITPIYLVSFGRYFLLLHIVHCKEPSSAAAFELIMIRDSRNTQRHLSVIWHKSAGTHLTFKKIVLISYCRVSLKYAFSESLLGRVE